MKHRVTMSDVAKKAGVHVTTVSLALRNHASLPLKTRERLQRLARQMNYHPDPALSALVAYRHRIQAHKDISTIAYVTNWNTALGWKMSPAHTSFFQGASNRAGRLGYHLEHFWLGEPNLTARRLGAILNSRGITGLILASHLPENDGPIDFDWSQFCAVKIDYAPRQVPLHMVTNHQTAIVRLAVQQALAAGYRRIGFVMPEAWDKFVQQSWSAGFLVEQYQLPAAERIPMLTNFGVIQKGEAQTQASSFTPPLTQLKSWLEKHRPEVIVSHIPFLASCFEGLRLSVPRDVAFADILLEGASASFAGVRQNCERVGELAMEILANQLNFNLTGIPSVPTANYVAGTWQDGPSLPRKS